MGRLLLGVSGGIAAYKAVELVRLATRAGHAVRVVQTPASLRFVGRSTFEAVTGAPVLVGEHERDPARGAYPGDPAPEHDPISHLELVGRADALAIAPASANTLAKLAAGLADNLLTSAALASRAPLVLAPAMNDRMWEHPATQANLDVLIGRGALVVPPEEGALASKGEWGVGRLANPGAVLAGIEAALGSAASAPIASSAASAPIAPGYSTTYAPRSLDGLRVLVTAGGTREPIDAVRYVGNRSSGRMGLALAGEAARRGADVVVVAANVGLERPDGVRFVDVETAAELEHAARAEFAAADVLLMAAAVADFRPAESLAGKIDKAGREEIALSLEPTTDVLRSLAAQRSAGQTLIGFAAEHGEGASARGQRKLAAKGLDAVVVNDVSKPGVGFDSPDNEIAIVLADEVRPLARAPKPALAAEILDVVEELRAEQLTGPVGAHGAPRP